MNKTKKLTRRWVHQLSARNVLDMDQFGDKEFPVPSTRNQRPSVREEGAIEVPIECSNESEKCACASLDLRRT